MTTPPGLLLVGRGTRDLVGVRAVHELVSQVRTRLSGVAVEAAFVDLTPPRLEDELAAMLADNPTTVVVPLLLRSGGALATDIPAALARVEAQIPDATIIRTDHLGSATPLRRVVQERISAVNPDHEPSATAVVLVGSGSLIAEANAEHAHLCRLLHEEGGYARVIPAFIQTSQPSLTTALDEAHRLGVSHLIVMPHFLFPGRLRARVRQATTGWHQAHLGASLAVTEVIGPCTAVVDAVAVRYRDAERRLQRGLGSPAYLTGLLLAGRRVVVVGGGTVARRRVPRLLQAGAQVTLIAPEVAPELAALADGGQLTWVARAYEPGDLAGSWFVVAATTDPAVNATVATESEAQHTFCVRSDDAPAGSAWTPATGTHRGVTVATLARRDPRRSKELRDRILGLLADE
ncbi:MAG: CbiX/SirB N-terminal domain-containing protein [Propioniciclava sp.]